MITTMSFLVLIDFKKLTVFSAFKVKSLSKNWKKIFLTMKNAIMDASIGRTLKLA